jgi:hypothetical protein
MEAGLNYWWTDGQQHFCIRENGHTIMIGRDDLLKMIPEIAKVYSPVTWPKREDAQLQVRGGITIEGRYLPSIADADGVEVPAPDGFDKAVKLPDGRTILSLKKR